MKLALSLTFFLLSFQGFALTGIDVNKHQCEKISSKISTVVSDIASIKLKIENLKSKLLKISMKDAKYDEMKKSLIALEIKLAELQAQHSKLQDQFQAKNCKKYN